MSNMHVFRQWLLLFSLLSWLPFPAPASGEERHDGVFAGILVPLKNFFWEDVEVYGGFYAAAMHGEETWGGEARIGYRIFEKTLLSEILGFYGDSNSQIKAGIGMEYRKLETLSLFFPFEAQQQNAIIGLRLSADPIVSYLSLSSRGSLPREQPRSQGAATPSTTAPSSQDEPQGSPPPADPQPSPSPPASAPPSSAPEEPAPPPIIPG